MDHAITVKDLLIGGGIIVFICIVIGVYFAFMNAMNTDL